MQRKKGISLIVLVISIIVMIILASAIILSLSNTGIFNKAQEAVDASDLKEVQAYAATVWAEAYLNGARTETALKAAVTEGLQDIKNISDYLVRVTEEGVEVADASKTLGGLIKSAEDYGKTVNYSVTVGEETYDDWQIYYHNDNYVYLIAAEIVGDVILKKGTTVASLTKDELTLYEKFRVGTADKYTLTDKVDGNTALNCQAVAQLIKDYSNFANTTDYGSNVVGAIGGPTIELLVAGWNAKGYTPTLTITTGTYGYQINGTTGVSLSTTTDDLYTQSRNIWFANPSDSDSNKVYIVGDRIISANCGASNGVRPVVCLKSSIPAKVNGDTGFTLE